MKHTAAWLSFFLPGLGQLSQRRFGWAALFFLTFVMFVAVRAPVWAVPLVALVAGVEAFRRGVPQIARGLARTYGVVGGIGFFAWVLYVAGGLLPLGQHQKVNADVEALRAAFKQCFSPHKTQSRLVLRCVNTSHPQLKDPWGRPYRLSFDAGIFEIRSWGPDGRANTMDDWVFKSHHPKDAP